MSKWARVNLEQESQVFEIITYNPEGVINEAFLPLFKPCPEEVEKGYWYNPRTNTFYLPEGYAKHPNFEIFGYVPKGDLEVDENGFIIFPPPPPPPKSVSLDDFVSQLSNEEKTLWDNPETDEQKQIINDAKIHFSTILLDPRFLMFLKSLEQNSILSEGRAQEIYDHLNA